VKCTDWFSGVSGKALRRFWYMFSTRKGVNGAFLFIHVFASVRPRKKKAIIFFTMTLQTVRRHS